MSKSLNNFKPSPEQIQAWVSKFFPDFKSRKGGEELNIANPLDLDTDRHLGINTKKAMCHDWRPGHRNADGSFVNFVRKFRNLSWAEAIREICGQEVNIRSLLRSGTEQEEQEQVKAIELPNGAIPFSSNGGKIRQVALSYLKTRGISEELANKKKLLFTVSGIVFPYYEYGDLVYWQMREILNKRFSFPPNTRKTDFIYGFDDVEPCTEIIVVESIFNALSLGENAVATGGASFGNDGLQVKKMQALRPQRIVLAPDNDDAGRKSLMDNFFMLEPYFEGRIWYSLPPKHSGVKDWNDVGKEMGWDAVKRTFEAGLSQLDQSVLYQMA